MYIIIAPPLQVSEMVHASEAVILHGGTAGDTAAAVAERALLKTRVAGFLRRMCSLAAEGAVGDDEAVTLASTIVTLSATALPRVERLRVPLPGRRVENEDNANDEKPSAYVREPFAVVLYNYICAYFLSLLH